MTNPRRILLLNPPHARRVIRDCYCSHVTKGAYYWQPLDLVVQSALLSDKNQVTVIDAIVDRISEKLVLETVKNLRPEWILMMVADCVAEDDIAFAARLKEAAKEAKIVGSGDIFLHDPGAALKKAAAFDGALLDFASTALADLIASRQPEHALAWREGQDVTVLPQETSKTFSYPTPPAHWFFPDRYRLPFYGCGQFHSIMTNYGCPFRCRFCHIPSLGYRQRDMNEVIAEIETAIKHRRMTLYFRDANFGIDVEGTFALCKWMAARPEKLTWNCFMRADMVNPDLLETMAQAGCRIVQIGIETLDEKASAKAGKSVDLDSLQKLIALFKKNDIRVSLHFLLGLQSDEWFEKPRASDDLISLGADYLSINILTPRPGTIWTEKEMVLGEGKRKQLMSLAGKITRRFYLRPTRLWQELVWQQTFANITFSAFSFLSAILAPVDNKQVKQAIVRIAKRLRDFGGIGSRLTGGKG